MDLQVPCKDAFFQWSSLCELPCCQLLRRHGWSWIPCHPLRFPSVLQAFGNFLFQVAYGDSHFLRQSWPLLLVSAENLDGLRKLCFACVCVFVFVCVSNNNQMQYDAIKLWRPNKSHRCHGSLGSLFRHISTRFPLFWQCVCVCVHRDMVEIDTWASHKSH
jgi:hypothetical protein